MNSFVVPAASYEAQNAYRRLQLTMDTSDPRMATLEIRTFLKMFPDLALAINDLGVLYAQGGEKLLALACYEKANRLQPGTPVIVKNLAEFYFVEIGWSDDAILLLTELLKSYPSDVELLSLLGALSMKLGRKQEAKAFFMRVQELDPSNRDAAAALGQLDDGIQVAEFRHQPAPVQQAQPQYQCQPTAEPANVVTPATASSSLDDVLARLRANIAGTTAPATAQPATAAPMGQDLHRQAHDAANNGDQNRAISLLQQLVADGSVNPLAHNDLGVLLTQTGQIDQACSHHELAVRQAPGNPTFAKNLADLYYSYCGRTDEAIRIFTDLLRQHPNDIEVLTALAVISKNNNLIDQARTFIRQVLNLEPWNSDARRFLVEL